MCSSMQWCAAVCSEMCSGEYLQRHQVPETSQKVGDFISSLATEVELGQASHVVALVLFCHLNARRAVSSLQDPQQMDVGHLDAFATGH